MASPSGRKRNVTQYDFLDEPIVDAASSSPAAPFALPSFPIASPGLRLSRDAGELFHLFFRHNLKPEINFAFREFEKKRGPAAQKSMDQAIDVMQLAHKGYANSQQLFDQFGVNALATARDCCDMIKEQLSKHTNYQEKLLHAEAQWGLHKEKEIARYTQAHREDQIAMEAQYCESVLALDERYTAGYEYTPSPRNDEERMKQIRREVLLAQLAIVKKRRADRKAAKAKRKQEQSTITASVPPEEDKESVSPSEISEQQNKTPSEQANPPSPSDHQQNGVLPTPTSTSSEHENGDRTAGENEEGDENEGTSENGHVAERKPDMDAKHQEEEEEATPTASAPPSDTEPAVSS